jgi:N-formylglutamate amidohydrolase
VLDDGELDQELLAVTDAWTDELFSPSTSDAARVIYPVSRLVCDPERFIDDGAEPMSSKGMGVVYTRTSDGRVLRPSLDDAERRRCIAAWYQPHHKALELAVAGLLARCGRVLVIDCHSFPSVPLPFENDQRPNRPQICIGTDPFHTTPGVAAAALAAARAEGWSVAENRPFAGALVPARFFRKDRRVLAVMIEVRRDLYMSEADGRKTAGFTVTRDSLGRMLERILPMDGIDFNAGCYGLTSP